MKFSQKKGLTPIRTVIQKGSINEALRNKLWNVVAISVWDKYHSDGIRSYTRNSNIGPLFCLIWNDFFEQPIDTIPQYFNEALSSVRKSYFNFEWFKVYDFIEFIAQNLPTFLGPDRFWTLCNSVLEEEKSAYRFLKGQLIEMTSDVELGAVEAAIETGTQFPGVEAHLRTAIKHLSDRKEPDFRNSIKESISAVESLCKSVTGDPKATLNKALAVLESKRKLHPRLKTSFSALYEYSSDADGIRHGMLDEPELSFVDAKYMLVVCSAFINYVTGKLSE
jgi:hypothetical protein